MTDYKSTILRACRILKRRWILLHFGPRWIDYLDYKDEPRKTIPD